MGEKKFYKGNWPKILGAGYMCQVIFLKLFLECIMSVQEMPLEGGKRVAKLPPLGNP